MSENSRYIRPVWKNAAPFFVLAVALSFCLSGSCKLPSIEISAGQSAHAATGREGDIAAGSAAGTDRLRVEDMGVVERDRYSRRLRNLVTKDPDFLLKLTGQDMDILFDAPDLSRREGNVITRHYKAGDCLMDVYLQLDSQNDDRTAAVVHYELRPRHVALLHPVRDAGDVADRANENGAYIAAGDGHMTCLDTMVEAGQDYQIAAR